MMRKVFAEPIHFKEDGSINEVKRTSQGAGPPLSAFDKIDAERACLLFGNVRIRYFEPDNEELAEIKPEDNVAFKYIDSREGATKVTFRIKLLKNGGNISVRLNHPWTIKIAWVNVH